MRPIVQGMESQHRLHSSTFLQQPLTPVSSFTSGWLQVEPAPLAVNLHRYIFSVPRPHGAGRSETYTGTTRHGKCLAPYKTRPIHLSWVAVSIVLNPCPIVQGMESLNTGYVHQRDVTNVTSKIGIFRPSFRNLEHRLKWQLYTGKSLTKA